MIKIHSFFLILVLLGLDTVQSRASALCSAIDGIYINELMSSNNIFEDEFEESDDWVEIYNANDTTVDLQGLYLSDDPEQLDKWTILESLVIPAHGYALLWLDGQVDQGFQHASFKLNSEGESLLLSQLVAGNVEIIDHIDFPKIPQNVSYGRQIDGEEP